MQALSALLYLYLSVDQLIVQDPSGAPIAHASCRVEGTAVEVRSDGRGVCEIPSAPTSKVRVTMPGFRSATVDAAAAAGKITLEIDPMRY